MARLGNCGGQYWLQREVQNVRHVAPLNQRQHSIFLANCNAFEFSVG